MIKNRIIQDIFEQLIESGVFERMVDAIADGKLDPYTACDEIVLTKVDRPE
jgi:hypothetical protein